ncbi:MAG: peptide chain release factor N(5)-glutamine methyltransferase [Gammaproteobacteria bacterium]|nr:peptide chain release factor N(5)-glutamine methyltransferase [Gammaproteobacteria bacterium]
MSTLGTCFATARAALPRAEAELLTTHALQEQSSALYAFPERRVPARLASRHANCIERRQRGEPVAYIIGERGFWNLTLAVDRCALIPRPETECLVEAALARTSPQPCTRVLDLGTGSGAVALAIAASCPTANVEGVDCDPACVALACRNAERLGIKATFYESDWFSAVEGPYDVILANPPYVAEDDPHLRRGDLRFEPHRALIGGPDGLSHLRQIVRQAPNYLAQGGFLLVEHGYDQADHLHDMFRDANFLGVETLRDLASLPRVTLGQRA